MDRSVLPHLILSEPYSVPEVLPSKQRQLHPARFPVVPHSDLPVFSYVLHAPFEASHSLYDLHMQIDISALPPDIFRDPLH